MKNYEVCLLVNGYDNVGPLKAASPQEAEETGNKLFWQKNYGCLESVSWKIDGNGFNMDNGSYTVWANIIGKVTLTVAAEDQDAAVIKAIKEAKALDFGDLRMSATTLDPMSVWEKKP